MASEFLVFQECGQRLDPISEEKRYAERDGKSQVGYLCCMEIGEAGLAERAAEVSEPEEDLRGYHSATVGDEQSPTGEAYQAEDHSHREHRRRVAVAGPQDADE